MRKVIQKIIKMLSLKVKLEGNDKKSSISELLISMQLYFHRWVR